MTAKHRVWSLTEMKGKGSNKPEPTNSDPQTHGDLWETWRLVKDEHIDVLYSRVAKGTRTGAHIHPETDHYTSVIEGQAFCWMDGEMLELLPGDVVNIPRNVLHNFGASEAKDVWLVDLTSPACDYGQMQFQPEREAEIAEAFAAALSRTGKGS
jgi:quercetin dioxygenase-like cupin family protein